MAILQFLLLASCSTMCLKRRVMRSYLEVLSIFFLRFTKNVRAYFSCSTLASTSPWTLSFTSSEGIRKICRVLVRFINRSSLIPAIACELTWFDYSLKCDMAWVQPFDIHIDLLQQYSTPVNLRVRRIHKKIILWKIVQTCAQRENFSRPSGFSLWNVMWYFCEL